MRRIGIHEDVLCKGIRLDSNTNDNKINNNNNNNMNVANRFESESIIT